MSETQNPDLEGRAAEALWTRLRQVPIGSELDIGPSSRLCQILEFLVPRMLQRQYPQWQRQSLDGFEFVSSTRTAEWAATLAGTCILMNDQTIAPCLFTIELADAQTLRAARIRLGEPGGGPLGISGPPWATPAAAKLLANLPARLDQIPWVYDLAQQTRS